MSASKINFSGLTQDIIYAQRRRSIRSVAGPQTLLERVLRKSFFYISYWLLNMLCDPVFDRTGVVEIVLWSADGEPAGGDCRSRLGDDDFDPDTFEGIVFGDRVRSVIEGPSFCVIICQYNFAGVTGLVADVHTFPGDDG